MSEVRRLRVLLRHTYRGPAWHGPALRELLDGVTAETAAARPLAAVHSIWELVSHVTYWRRIAAGALAGGPVDPEPPDELNFPPVDDPSPQAWERTLAELEESQKALLACLKDFPDERLSEHVDGREFNFYFLLHGVIQHDLYHAGQMALLRKA